MNRIDSFAKGLESIAVDRKALATNFTDVIPDCSGVGVDIKTELQNRYQLYLWLINTSLSRRVREMINGDNGACILYKDSDGYHIQVPGTFWSTANASQAGECCWVPFDFAKCENNVPVNRLCLKDCDSIDDELLGRLRRLNAGYGDVASRGATYWDTKKRIARMSMAFLTAYTVIDGTDNNDTGVLKPFHGLLQLMQNPAVTTVSGTNVLAAFDEIFCRLAFLGGGDYIFAVNPLIYQSILSVIVPGQFGEYPRGWSRSGDVITFNGIGFLQDKHVPVDLQNATGEVWVLAGDAVGAWMATDLMPADDFIKESGHKEETLENGCGSSCTYYYNFGTTFNNNATKLMRITDVAVSANCVNATGDLGGLIFPETLIPTIG